MGRFFLSGSYHYVKKLHSKQYISPIEPEVNEKKDSLKISLITVSFNRQETIEDTILSVQSQSYTNLEYIIIDGASTDNTLNIIKKYPDVVSHFVSERDEGIYDAMNKGISRASGDIIGFINADDVLASPEVLKNVAQTFSSNNIDACYADLVYVDQFNLKDVKRYWRSSGFKAGAFSKGWSPPHPTFYVKKSVYEQFGLFSLDYELGNDIELMLRFLEKYQINSLYVPNLWVKMRMGGVSNQSIANVVLQNKEIIQAAKDNNVSFSALMFIFGKLKMRFKQYFFR
ncbi:MAG: glycosyltransferase [gamma proteobacterium symbiont of Taylorina sp.]|nr:glycosyltransferase [gamma proteobacterium symbiont of Taylorina sp.]